jgi:hypothetical protein
LHGPLSAFAENSTFIEISVEISLHRAISAFAEMSVFFEKF